MRTLAAYLASVIVCVYLLLPRIVAAQSCISTGTAVYYVNGVWVTTRNKAQQSLDALALRFDAFRQNTVVQNECIDYVLAYNQSELYLGDLLETSVQVLGGAMSNFWRFWAGLDPLPAWFQQQALSITQSIDNTTYVLDSDLKDHVKLYRQSLTKGHRVAVVAHSQGNLYANAAFNILYDGLDGKAPLTTQSFGVAAVATVANFVEGGGPYTTSTGDLVVDGLISAAQRLHLPPPLLPNTFGLPSLVDPTGHLFAPSYLEGSATGQSVLEDLLNIVLSLEWPPISPPEPGIWNEDFEGLNLGEISGQGQWVAFAGDGTVDNSQAFTGSQSLRLDNGGTRLLMPGGFLSGFGSMVTSYLRIGTIGSGASGAMYFNDHQIAESPVTLSCTLGHTLTLGHIRFNDEVLKEIAENTWYKLDVELDYSANRCRGRVDNESWSGWQNILPGNRPLHVAFIGSIGFAQSSTHEVWFDDLSVSGPAISE